MRLKAILEQLGISKERAKLLRISTIKLNGVTFVYKALAPLDFMNFGRSTDPFAHPVAPYKESTEYFADQQAKKKAGEQDLSDPNVVKKIHEDIRKQYEPIFLKAVLWPLISAKEDKDKVYVGDLFVDPDMGLVTKLYAAIINNSVKKKTSLISWVQSVVRLTSLRRGTVAYPTR